MKEQLKNTNCDQSIKFLLKQIEAFLCNNPSMTAPEFGHLSARDTGLVERIRKGGDVTTRKWHRVISFIENPTR